MLGSLTQRAQDWVWLSTGARRAQPHRDSYRRGWVPLSWGQLPSLLPAFPGDGPLGAAPQTQSGSPGAWVRLTI